MIANISIIIASLSFLSIQFSLLLILICDNLAPSVRSGLFDYKSSCSLFSIFAYFSLPMMKFHF